MDNLPNLLGLIHRAGKLAIGEEPVAALCRDHKAYLLLLAQDAAENSVRRAAILCYAVEGRYPDSAEELCQHYGLSYDENKYIVQLDSFASNLLPDIRILTIGGEADE